jgi:hypothetical protein
VFLGVSNQQKPNDYKFWVLTANTVSDDAMLNLKRSEKKKQNQQFLVKFEPNSFFASLFTANFIAFLPNL